MTSDYDQTAQTLASIGIDIGKDVFHIVGFDAAGKIVVLPYQTNGMSGASRPQTSSRLWHTVREMEPHDIDHQRGKDEDGHAEQYFNYSRSHGLTQRG
jgi:hypothetical protein